MNLITFSAAFPLTILLVMALPITSRGQDSSVAPNQQTTAPASENVSMQFPHASVLDILSFYEKLTGKRIIRDSNLQGPEISIMVANQIPLGEAVSLIESSLLLNGYTFVPVDSKTVKILGPSRPPRAEGLPLYREESELPANGDKIVSFYKPLKFLSPQEAISILQGVVQLNAYGSLVAIPNTSALVITDKTPIIRKALALLEVVDHEPNQIITEFIPLQRASAEKIVETLGQMFGSGGSGGGGTPAPQGQGQQGAVVSGGGEAHLLSGKAQFIADKRTNRLLIVVRAENYKYLRELIAKLDQPVESDQPLVRPLNYLPVSDVFPVLVDLLKGKDDATNSATTSQTTQQTQQQQNQNQSGSTTTQSQTGAIANSPDKLSEVAKENPPQSARVGSTSIVADPGANSIIIYGPPESKTKAGQIINLLDQRPKQVYLAAVIGQLQLTEGIDYGATWFAKINTTGGSNNLIGAAVSSSIANSLNSLLANGVSNAISSFPSSLTGLTVYGTVAQGISTYARFLETTGKFRTLSRPVVYTSNNKKATIFNGQNVPIPGTSTYNTVGAVGSNSLNNVTSTVQYQPVVLKLEIIPLINSDKEVNLIIAQHNDKLGDYVNVGGNQVPNILTQELTTTVRVPNGSTIVLGGLITDDKTVDEQGIPFLNRIPIVGALAGGRSNKVRKRSELVIMIQPIVVDSNDVMEKASRAEGGESDLGRRAESLKNKLTPTPTPVQKKPWFKKVFEPKKLENF
jgi:general secretion pathway protein D